MKAIWNNQVIAESNDTILAEGNHYFPPNSINKEFVKDSATQSTCPFKGEASYFTLVVDGQENKDAAWYYPSIKPQYEKIAGYVAFWRGVTIEN